jgi:ribosomal protein S18 acetylase RimI-like enzyme
VRCAEKSDLPTLAAIRQEREGGRLEELLPRFSLLLHGRPAARILLVGLVDGELAGYGLAGRFQPPRDAPANHAPAGWYLQGVIVRPDRRRLGLGAELTRRRLEWISSQASEAYYFANSGNRASIALHSHFGFEEVSRDFWYPDVAFTGGQGILFRAVVPEQRAE